MRKKTRRLQKMGATNKRAKRIRYEGEFPLSKLAPETRYPLRMLGDFAWDTDTIRGARSDQLRGSFSHPAKLARAMNSDAGLFTARLNRLAPLRGLPIELKAADDGTGNPTTRSMRVRDEADALFGKNGLCFGRDSMTTLHKQYVDHGVAIGYNRWTVRVDKNGFPMRVDVETLAWPLEYVKYFPQARAFFTLTKSGELMRIDHGDGRWVVVQQEKLDPWASGCIVPGCMVWADRAYAIRDRSNASRAHGQPKMRGEMPPGISIFAKDPTSGVLGLTPEAQAILLLLQQFQVGDLPSGLVPSGSKIDQMVNQSQAWQIWTEMVKTDDQDADRIYLGEDAITTDSSVYVQNDRLFGVRDYLVKADIEAFVEGFRTGTIEPWAAINFGDSSLAPSRRWLMPDADEDARKKSIGERLDKFFATITNLKMNGFAITQDVVNKVAAELDVPRFDLTAVDAATSSPSGPPKALPPPAPKSSDSEMPIAAE